MNTCNDCRTWNMIARLVSQKYLEIADDKGVFISFYLLSQINGERIGMVLFEEIGKIYTLSKDDIPKELSGDNYYIELRFDKWISDNNRQIANKYSSNQLINYLNKDY